LADGTVGGSGEKKKKTLAETARGQKNAAPAQCLPLIHGLKKKPTLRMSGQEKGFTHRKKKKY